MFHRFEHYPKVIRDSHLLQWNLTDFRRKSSQFPLNLPKSPQICHFSAEIPYQNPISPKSQRNSPILNSFFLDQNQNQRDRTVDDGERLQSRRSASVHFLVLLEASRMSEGKIWCGDGDRRGALQNADGGGLQDTGPADVSSGAEEAEGEGGTLADRVGSGQGVLCGASEPRPDLLSREGL